MSIDFNVSLGTLGVIPMPICYAFEKFTGSSTGFIILEDLSGNAAILHGVDKGVLSLEKVLNVVEVLANFHVWSLSTDIPLSEYFGTAQDYKENWGVWLECAKSAIVAIKNAYPEEFGDVNVEKALHYFEFDNFLKLQNNYIGIVPPVLVHGDFWSNNIMFKINPSNGQLTDEVCAVLDWSSSWMGSCMNDFGRLFSCFPVEFLETHSDTILQKYYNTVKSKCGPKFTASYHDIKKLYDEQIGLSSLMYAAMAHLLNARETDENVIKRNVKLAQAKYKAAAKALNL